MVTLEVVNCQLKKRHVVVELPKSRVAFSAQKTAKVPRGVVMIHIQISSARAGWLSADLAAAIVGIVVSEHLDGVESVANGPSLKLVPKSSRLTVGNVDSDLLRIGLTPSALVFAGTRRALPASRREGRVGLLLLASLARDEIWPRPMRPVAGIRKNLERVSMLTPALVVPPA